MCARLSCIPTQLSSPR